MDANMLTRYQALFLLVAAAVYVQLYSYSSVQEYTPNISNSFEASLESALIHLFQL